MADGGDLAASLTVAPPVPADAVPIARKPVGIRLRRAADRFGGPAFAITFILLLYGPLVLLAAFSFNDSMVFSLPWAGFTTKWYHQALGDANLRQALRNSIVVAGIVAPVSVILGTLAAYPITRLRFRLRGAAAVPAAAPIINSASRRRRPPARRRS